MGQEKNNIAAYLLLGLGAIGVYATFALKHSIFHSDIKGLFLLLSLLCIVLGVFRIPTKKHTQFVNIAFLFPMVFTFAVTVLIPFILGIIYSFTDWNGMRVGQFVGLANYIKMFQQMDFVYAFFITLLFTVINMFLVNGVAFGLALLVTSNVRGKNFFRAAYFLPNLIGGLVLGYVWQFIFNRVFTMYGAKSMLTDPNLALFSILVVSTWQYAGYIMMIYVTGLQTVPRDVLEAANVDGANSLITLHKIKIPMIANTFTVCIFMTLVNSFKQFDLNLSITKGGPARMLSGKAIQATEFLALNIYNTAITKNNYALGQTKAVVFFVLLAIVSLTQVSISKRKEIEL